MYDKAGKCIPTVVNQPEDSRYNDKRKLYTDAELPRSLISNSYRIIIPSSPALQGIDTKLEYIHRLMYSTEMRLVMSCRVGPAKQVAVSITVPIIKRCNHTVYVQLRTCRVFHHQLTQTTFSDV